MKALLLALGAGLLAVWPIASPPTPSSAQTDGPALDRYGWWNLNQALPPDPTGGLLPPAVTIPAPPTAPADGLYVEQGANGVAAIAAVNYYTGGGVDASLTLLLADTASPAAPTLAACPAGGGWDAAQNGAWAKRPTYDPANCKFLGTVQQGAVTFSVPAAAHEPGSSFLSVVIVPAEGSGIFSVGFKPPTSASLVTRAAPASAAPPSASPAPAYAPLPVTFGGDAYAPPTFETPALATTATSAPRQAARVGTSAGERATDKQTSDRVVAILLLALGALGAMSSRRMPRLWFAGNTAPRGLGRFARDREGPPNRI